MRTFRVHDELPNPPPIPTCSCSVSLAIPFPKLRPTLALTPATTIPSARHTFRLVDSRRVSAPLLLCTQSHLRKATSHSAGPFTNRPPPPTARGPNPRRSLHAALRISSCGGTTAPRWRVHLHVRTPRLGVDQRRFYRLCDNRPSIITHRTGIITRPHPPVRSSSLARHKRKRGSLGQSPRATGAPRAFRRRRSNRRRLAHLAPTHLAL